MLAMALVFGLWPFIYGSSATPWLFAALAIILFFLSFRTGVAWKAAASTGFLALALVGGAANLQLEATFKPAQRIGGSPPDSPNVILITVDTLRFDALFGPADQRPETPTLDAFASQSYVFKNAISSGPWTAPGVAGLVTGLGPSTHGVGLTGRRIPDEIPTIAGRMAEADYQVAACGLNPFIQITGVVNRFPWTHWHPYRPFGLSFGNRFLTTQVDYYLWNPSSDQLTGWAIDWFSKNRDSRFFYWLHYYDPHIPYDPPAPFVDRQLEDPVIGPFLDWDDADRVRVGAPRVSAGGRRWMRHLYDAEVRYIDQNLERLFARLEELGLFDESLIILTSDHGEEFFDHGGYEHGQNLYNELLHVPLMIKPPGGTGGRREIDKFVGTAATTPTILDLAGVQYDPADFSYPSLRPLLDGAAEAEGHPVFSAGVEFFENWVSVVFDDSYKYIRREVTGQEELYDLVADPLEQRRLDNPELMERGRKALHKEFEIASALRKRYGVTLTEEGKANENTRRLLESLGYIQ